jgi:hypothetical protein
MEVDTEEVNPQVIADDGFELVLPSGRWIHRKLILKSW